MRGGFLKKEDDDRMYSVESNSMQSESHSLRYNLSVKHVYLVWRKLHVFESGLEVRGGLYDKGGQVLIEKHKYGTSASRSTTQSTSLSNTFAL